MEDELGVLSVRHGERPVQMKMTEGGYAIQDDRITISVSAEVDEETADDDAYPHHGCICIEGAPLDGALKEGDVFEHTGGMMENDYDELPRAHGYFGFHVEEIRVKWTVLSVSDDVCRFALEAFHDDVDYYDERAKPHPSTGTFDLPRSAEDDLWVPV